MLLCRMPRRVVACEPIVWPLIGAVIHRSFLREHEAAVLPAVTTELKAAVTDGVAISADQVRPSPPRPLYAKGYSVAHKGHLPTGCLRMRHRRFSKTCVL